MSNTTKDFISSIQTASKEKTSAYDSTATVKRIEGSTAWVHIPGGVDETPVAMTMNAKEGDSVQVRVSNGHAFLVGNATSPPTDDTTAEAAKAIANRAAEDAGRAKTAADIAESYATSAQASAAQSANILEGMEQAAIAAGTTLDGIYADAAEAKATTDEINDYADTAGKTVTQILNDGETAGAAASAAQQAADTALVNLATTEDVVGVLNWITAHGTMVSQYGGTFDPDKVYFIVDPTGDYVVSGTHYSVVPSPVAEDIDSYYILNISESVQNYVATHIVVNAEGLWIIPDAGGNKVLIATGSGSTYTTAGTYIVGKVGGVDTVLAEFTASGAVIGENASGKSRTIISADGMQVYRNVSGTDTQIANLGYGSGTASGGGTADAPYYTLGKRRTTSISDYDPTQTYQKGDLCKYNGDIYVCIINIPVAEAWNGSHWEYYIGNYSVSEGAFTTSSGHSSHAEGNMTIASGEQSHAEGYFSKATDAVCHAEGYNTTASGYTDHAEGYNTTANGGTSHAEGYSTIASGMSSHAQNSGTIAAKSDQTAIGRYNIEDTTVSDEKQKSFIIGNGTADNARSNALTVDWSGNVEAAGDVTDGSSNTLSSVATTLSSIAAHAVISTGSSNGWNYKKYADGTFEATRFSTNGSTGAMTQVGSTGIYYSSAAEITFPSIGITGITSCLASVMPSSNYLMSYYMSRLTTAHVYFSYIRYGSGSAVTGISYGISITGTYS